MKNVFYEINSFFQGNYIFNILSFAIGIIGIISSFYFYFKSKRSRIPIYFIRTINLVRERIQKLDTVEIFFSGKRIINLSITKIAILNIGKETINFMDVAINNPLKVIIDDKYEILEAEILVSNNNSNDFKISIEENKKAILIKFDYFDYEEGLVLQLAHTGNSNEDIVVTGNIKSVKKIIRKDYTNVIFPSLISFFFTKIDSLIKPSSDKIFNPWLIIVTGILLCLMPFFNLIDQHFLIKQSFVVQLILYTSISLPYVMVGIRMLKEYPKGIRYI